MDRRHRIERLLLGGLVAGMAGLARSLVVVVHSYVGGSFVVVVGRLAVVVRFESIRLPCRRGLAERLDLTLSLMLIVSRSIVGVRLN